MSEMCEDKIKLAARNLIERFRYANSALTVLSDEAFRPFSEAVGAVHGDTALRFFSTYTPETVSHVFSGLENRTVLLLAEPQSYVRYQLYTYLDFDGGEPAISGTRSHVLVFPFEALTRMLSVSAEKDLAERDRILRLLQPYGTYRITTSSGTDLCFEARTWIPLDFEVCTAPVESSVNGRIVADGALFFRKIDEPIVFTIEDGKVTDITADTETGCVLLEEYRKMTAHDMADSVNTQLAEIGIGFCHGAEISDCFMEAETAINTCHFCFGNNVCYGGENKSDFHGASVLIRNPVFKIM